MSTGGLSLESKRQQVSTGLFRVFWPIIIIIIITIVIIPVKITTNFCKSTIYTYLLNFSIWL